MNYFPSLEFAKKHALLISRVPEFGILSLLSDVTYVAFENYETSLQQKHLSDYFPRFPRGSVNDVNFSPACTCDLENECNINLSSV